MKLANLVNQTQWSNPELRLFHGTDTESVDSILGGIDISVLHDSSDFGRGFYTTTNLVQAQSWALRRARRRPRHAAVVEFLVSRDELAKLESMWFVRAAADTDDFWSLVEACVEAGIGNRGGSHWYDVVVGPVSSSYAIRSAWENYDQVSFHTPRAFKVLDNSGKRRL